MDEGVVLGAFAAGGGGDVEVWAEHVDVEVDGLEVVTHVEVVVPEICEQQNRGSEEGRPHQRPMCPTALIKSSSAAVPAFLDFH